MGRASVVVRTAVLSDAPELVALWAEHLRPGTREAAVADVCAAVEAADADDAARLVVAELDGEIVGSLHVRATALSPMNAELTVHAFGPQVRSDFRHRGVGTALMEVAVAFAEERGIQYVSGSALSTSRDSNRFFARLSMGPRAVLRVSATHVVRQRLGVGRSARVTGGSPTTTRNIDRVLAVRRGRRASRVAS